jgi:DNA-binding response OmpR family regulator
MMPAGGGMQLLQRLTSVGEVPVIVMTALTDGKVEAEAKAAQAGED